MPKKGCSPIAKFERGCCVQVSGEDFMLGLAVSAIQTRDRWQKSEDRLVIE